VPPTKDNKDATECIWFWLLAYTTSELANTETLPDWALSAVVVDIL
jgi:uncharacterized membrane protein